MNPDIAEKLKEKYGAEAEDVQAPAWKIMFVLKEGRSRLGRVTFSTREECEKEIAKKKGIYATEEFNVFVTKEPPLEPMTLSEARGIDPQVFCSSKILFMYPYPLTSS